MKGLSLAPLKWKAITGTTVATFLVFWPAAVGAECEPYAVHQSRGWSGFGYEINHDTTSVFFVPSGTDTTAVRPDPRLGFTFRGLLEELAREAEILPVFVGVPPSCGDIGTRTTWSAASPVAVMEKVLADCGLSLLVRGTFGIVAQPERLQTTAVIITIGPIAGHRLSSSAEEALYRDLYLHWFHRRYVFETHSLYVVKIGYLAVPEDPNDFIIFAGTGEGGSGGQYRVIRARLSGGQSPSAACQWVNWSGGSPVESFTEDFDGDGNQDIVINRHWRETWPRGERMPSSIVSGATGRELLSFVSSKLAIQRTDDGRIRIAAQADFSQTADEGCLPIFEWTPETGKFERVDVGTQTASASGACRDAGDRLAASWDGPSEITIYDLLQSSSSEQSGHAASADESRVIPARSSWSYPRRPFDFGDGRLDVNIDPGSRALFTHVPHGYVEAVMAPHR